MFAQKRKLKDWNTKLAMGKKVGAEPDTEVIVMISDICDPEVKKQENAKWKAAASAMKVKDLGKDKQAKGPRFLQQIWMNFSCARNPGVVCAHINPHGEHIHFTTFHTSSWEGFH
ncbi:hypothetical protein FRB94_014792, partial [Tulasnella sp. JGI-2019a]